MNTTRSLILFLALALFGLLLLAHSTPAARAADPVIVRVRTSGTTTWPCGDATNWSNACALQTALTRSLAGSELWVAAGTYTPTTGADRTASFHLIDGVALYGGFAMTETLRTQRNYTANVTVLSGDINAQGDASDNAYHVVMAGGGTNTAVLDGFTVTGGDASGSDWGDPTGNGGGIYNDSGSLMVTNVTVVSNTAHYGGGGMYNLGSSPMLTNVTFRSNSVEMGSGGGMRNENSSPTLTNVTFIGNYTTGQGGGMFNYISSSPTLVNVTFFGNNAWSHGGGMANGSGSSPTLISVTFSGNTADQGGGMSNYGPSSPSLTSVTFMSNTVLYHGGGMFNDAGASPTLTNVTFFNNTGQYGGGMTNNTCSPALTNVTLANNYAVSHGGGMYNYNDSKPTIRNTIFWGNTAPNDPQIYNSSPDLPVHPSAASLFDTVVQGGCPTGSTCFNVILADPRLGAPGHYGGTTATIPLLPGSSAIDSGNDAVCPATDQRGVPRPQGAHCDIGACEAQATLKQLNLPFIRR